MNQTSKTARTASALDYLHRRFPVAFVNDPAAVHPLAVGTREALHTAIAEDPLADPAACDWALRRWCLSRAYTAALAAGRPRIDIEGHITGGVAPEHQAAAAARLATEGDRTAERAKRRDKAERMKAKGKAAGAANRKPPAPTTPGKATAGRVITGKTRPRATAEPSPAVPSTGTTNERTGARPTITIKRRRPSVPE
ncbi:sRNA-binding protein [Plasticicumulans lactativorans]|uniref:SRNA-binding protein n=1 Tax=Plasticicumulans lactativorans TaxID=1133106 RepID=A0A4R2LEQ3_9GAMM|nr:ProQ/FINO family protein [Plasticicumulans lactativorans]TCO83073.1 sRNA-binding protein [Plasticicumulans lactativorans]